MQIIEQTVVPKSLSRKSEDGIVATSDFIAVIDGSTSKTDCRYSRSDTNGRYAMRLIARYIERMAADTTCRQFCTAVTEVIARAMCRPSIIHGRWHRRPMPDPVDRLAASAVVFSRLRREIWMVGDCLCMVNGQLFENAKPHEARLAARRADIIMNSADRSPFFIHDTARDEILPEMLQIMREQQNKDFAVIDGTPIPQQHVRILTLDFQPKEIVLASDGYPFLCPTLHDAEEALARQLADDPLNIRTFQATKGCMQGNQSFDDRAYIRFKA